MEWTADVSDGDWVRDGIDDPWRGTIHDVVPRGFPAYARVFHPAFSDRPVAGDWPDEGDRAAWEAFLRASPEVDGRGMTWAETASAFGTVMHPLAQWQRLVRAESPYGSDGAARDSEGWRYSDPPQGQLDAASWTLLATVLARHTTTPDDGGVAVWEGWGGLVGAMGYGASRVMFAATDDPQHAGFLGHAARDVFNNVFKKPTWQPGVLSDEISRSPRLELPGRPYVLFRGGVRELTAQGWTARMPWADHGMLAHGLPSHPESPGIMWPADRAWITVSEVDFDSTVVGGDAALIDDLVRTPGLEVERLPADADLSWTGDRINGE